MNTSVVSITDLRKNLFEIANRVVADGKEVEIEKDGQRIMKLVKITDDPSERARRVLKIAKKIGGKFKHVNFDRSFFRGKKVRSSFR